MMFWTWVRSVLGVMYSRWQISGVDRPSVSARSTSSSRGVSCSTGGCSACRSRASATRRAIATITDARQERRAGVRGPDRLHDVLERPVLGEVAVGAGLDRLEHRLVVVDGRQHHDPRRRPARLDRARRLGAGAVGQPVVHEDDVERLARRLLGLGDACPRSPTIRDVRLRAEHAGERLRDQAMVVDEQHADRAGSGGAGGRAHVTRCAAVRVGRRHGRLSQARARGQHPGQAGP